MNWQQSLVDSSVSVNRSIFEMNRRGLFPPLQAEPRKDYILNEMKSAAEDLKCAIKLLEIEITSQS